MSKPVRYFMYYIEGLKNARDAKAAVVEKIGASVHGTTMPIKDCASGPGKSGPGLLCAAIPSHIKPDGAEVERRLEYNADPAKQTWMECNGYWIGFHNDLKPGPDDLRRDQIVAGYTYNCKETGSWIVPLARKVDGGTLFDQRIVYKPDGTICKEPLTRYKAICDFAAEHFEKLSGLDPDSDGLVFEADQRYCDVACEAISINYHAGPYELSVLEMLTMNGAAYICSFLCDFPGLIEIITAENDVKKNQETSDS